MRKYSYLITAFSIMIISLIGTESCKQKGATKVNIIPEIQVNNITFDSMLVVPFFKSYPLLEKYENDLVTIYRKSDFSFIWFDKKGTVEFGNSLYSKVKDLEAEGISVTFPYQEKIDGIFIAEKENTLNNTDAELMLTSLYLFYAEKVYKGLDNITTTDIGWLLPRKKVSYTSLLDSIISDHNLLNQDSLTSFNQYYKLRSVLKRYRAIEEKGGWNPIDLDPGLKAYRPNDTAKAIQQIRNYLFSTGDIKENNESKRYDTALVAGVKRFKLRNGYKPGSLITPELIAEMNVPVSERIKVIVVNMERCRWVSPETFNAKEYIIVNIPAYTLNLVQDGIIELDSPVVVGDSMNKTVIFGGKMSYIVFSPYWNIPKSIIENEVKPGMEKNKNYLASHYMEWNNGNVRQKPGKNNSLGLVKFIFPNTDDIYLHDSPAKSLFTKENRALSHGCIRVAKAKDLAFMILKDDQTWTPQKIVAAMNAGKESICTLKKKIPVYIGYFTAWVDEAGEIHFYKDVYERDERLADLLMYKNPQQ